MIRHYVTLVELLIALALIGIIAGAIGWNVQGMLQEQEFRSSVGLVVDKLLAAQEIMLIHNEDVSFIAERQEGVITAWLETETPLKSDMGQLLVKPAMLKGINSVVFKDGEAIEVRERLIIRFSASDKRTPKGVLQLSAYKNASMNGPLKSYITLTGYPRPLTAVAEPDISEDKPFENERLFPHEIMNEWEKRKNAQTKKS